jgi:hypothetical protein
MLKHKIYTNYYYYTLQSNITILDKKKIDLDLNEHCIC